MNKSYHNFLLSTPQSQLLRSSQSHQFALVSLLDTTIEEPQPSTFSDASGTVARRRRLCPSLLRASSFTCFILVSSAPVFKTLLPVMASLLSLSEVLCLKPIIGLFVEKSQQADSCDSSFPCDLLPFLCFRSTSYGSVFDWVFVRICLGLIRRVYHQSFSSRCDLIGKCSTPLSPYRLYRRRLCVQSYSGSLPASHSNAIQFQHFPTLSVAILQAKFFFGLQPTCMEYSLKPSSLLM